MRIAEVVGKVTLCRSHPSLAGATWVLAVPLMLDGLLGEDSGREEPFVVFDERGAHVGSMIAVSEGAEASAPFHPGQKPIDAYATALLDTIEVAQSSNV